MLGDVFSSMEQLLPERVGLGLAPEVDVGDDTRQVVLGQTGHEGR
jgi:hypothetical protein